jgi:tagatose 1,6-diphosphate aldolase
MSISAGKIAGLNAVSDKYGVIAAVAMDQRSSLKKALGDDVSDEQLEEFKVAVTEILTPNASAVLLDPEWGLAASKRRAKNAGLLLAYEKSGYDYNRPGRIPELLPHYSVRRLKDAGADCCKVLLYYSPLEKTEINDEKHAFVERVGDECRGFDIPLFLELVTYAPSGRQRERTRVRKEKAGYRGEDDSRVHTRPVRH